MPTSRARHSSVADSSHAVDAFFAELEHPQKVVIEAIRAAIMGADPSIAEGIKWNAPSYRTLDYFATTSLREKQGVGVILHRGAKVKAEEPDGMRITDPDKQLTWLAHDRAKVSFRDLDDFKARRCAFVTIIKEWIDYLVKAPSDSP